MLQVRDNEISLCKWSGGYSAIAHLVWLCQPKIQQFPATLWIARARYVLTVMRKRFTKPATANFIVVINLASWPFPCL